MKLKIGVSACLLGRKCNFNGQDLLSSFVSSLQSLEQVELISFCPEDFAFGSPRPNLRIVGGNGDDVLDGKAKVIDENERDVTDGQIAGAHEFLNKLKERDAKYVILMEGSPSCGSHILLKEESWPRGGFKKGSGVACALIRRAGIRTFSSFDEKSISLFLSSLVASHNLDKGLLDLKDRPKFKEFLDN